MAYQWVYPFSEGSLDMVDTLGGKGAGLAEMSRARLPVPPGFTITTGACRSYYTHDKHFPEGMWSQSKAALLAVEEATGKRFGDPSNPLLVSARSGAPVSMPGMMDTVTNASPGMPTAASCRCSARSCWASPPRTWTTH